MHVRHWCIPTVVFHPQTLWLSCLTFLWLACAPRCVSCPPAVFGFVPPWGGPAPALSGRSVTCGLILSCWASPVRTSGLSCESFSPEWDMPAGTSAGATSASGRRPSSRSPDPPGCSRRAAQPPQAPCLPLCPQPRVRASWEPQPAWPLLSCCDVQGPFLVVCRRRLMGALPTVPLSSVTASPLNPHSSSGLLSSFVSQWALEVDQKPRQGLFLGPPLPSQGLHFAFEVPRGDPSGLRPGGQQPGPLSCLQPSASSPPGGLGRAGLQGRLLTSAPSPPRPCGVWSESSALWPLTGPLPPSPPNQRAAGVPGRGGTPPTSASLCETSRALAVTPESLERKMKTCPVL